jgi:hypothetical protein
MKLYDAASSSVSVPPHSELLCEFLNLQKDMIVLKSNVLNGPIGKQMVDVLVESQQCVEMIVSV